ncbi:transient receptor potential cation channel subfamily M member 1-like [Mytilus edulis]|uniref:transient receptor potential cation channel subfamily M member 1-like n=1 Tax=Mytilus edulis TaxID=6550 RepID=UPI0039EED306
MVDTGRSEVEVMWFKDRSKSSHRILDLKYLSGGAFFYYYDHLPALGRDSQGYFAVNIDLDNQATKKIQVDIWRTIQQVQKHEKDIYKPSLYLIFANHTEVDKKESKGDKNDKLDLVLMEEVLDFAKKTKLPCHVVGQKVLFHSGSSHAVFIHYKTEKDTVKELVEKGFRKFERGDMDEENGEDEIHYFLRMAKYVSGEAVLPVVISLRNGGMTTEMMKYTAKSKIPIIRLKKHSLDVSVLTHQKIYHQSVHMTEHITDIKNPWSIKTSKPREYTLGKYDGKDDPDEIALISKIQSDFPDNLDALVCCLLIGVSMVEGSIKKKIFGSYTKVYPNALSMYLLKEGKWRIPKENIKTSFDYRSLEYIFEEDMTSEIKNGLWSYLQSMTNMAYKAPDFKEKKVDDSEDEDESAKASKTDEDINKITSKIAKTKMFLKIKKDKQKKKKRKELKLKVSTSELYGLILYALLKKQYWEGAQQLIETGCIRIRYILIGCVILEDEISNWRTNSFLKEKLQRLKSAITQRAIRITSCINEADKKKKDVSAKLQKEKIDISKKDSENKEEQQLGEHIKHAGRLLVNHGYIEDAIKTQNKTFLDNSTVRNILNEMWYGTEKLDKRTSVCFFGLAVVHMLVLPLLMISMEAGPLIRFYKMYNLPFMKVSMQMFGFLTLNTAYAYMLLFDYSDEGITYVDYFIIVWMVSFFVDETKQLVVSIIRKKWKSYASDCWNQLDWLSMIVYAFGMFMKSCQGPRCRDVSKVLLVTAFIFLSIRILNLFCMSAMLGPKLVMIRKMARDTVSFMIILAVIMMCYNISFYALLYPNSELSWLQIEKIIQNGYWMLFGELNLDSVTLSEPHCTFNRAVYENTDVPRCPAKLGVYLTPYLKALYGLIAVILLLNLLIAMYSDTFQKVQKESEFYWAQIQTDFLEEYSIKTVFPVHLQLLVLPATIVHAIFWLSCPHLCGKLYKIYRDQGFRKRDKKALNYRPMFVRVFWYNTNFDLKLKTTKEAEGNGALKAKGEIDLSEVDRITMLERKMDTNSKKQDKQNEKQDKQNDKNGRQNEKIMENMQHVDKKLKGIKTMLSKIAKTLDKYEDETEDEDDNYQFGFLSTDKNDSDSESVSSDDYVRRPNMHW